MQENPNFLLNLRQNSKFMSKQNSLITIRGNIGSDHQGYKLSGDRYTRLRSYNLELNSSNVKNLTQFSPLRDRAHDLSVVSSTMARFLDQLDATQFAFEKTERTNSRLNKAVLRYLQGLGQTAGSYNIPITQDALRSLIEIVNSTARYRLESVCPGITYDSGVPSITMQMTQLYNGSLYRQMGFNGFKLASPLAWLLIPATYDSTTDTFTAARSTVYTSADNTAFFEDITFKETPGTLKFNPWIDSEALTGAFILRSVYLVPFKVVNGSNVYSTGHSTFAFTAFEEV